jgi:hypothetical protein
MNIKCPLCFNQTPEFYADIQTYYRCPHCDGIFVDENDLIRKDIEKRVYEQHNIDTKDEGYRKFVSPITESIVDAYRDDADGLDFGAGRSAIISAVLEEKGYVVKNYDPFFHDNKALLENRYEFISACEVVEHFHKPNKEFHLLKNMLTQNGKIYIMTDLYDGREFGSWYYKNDPTHVFFYTAKTFEFIKEEFGFKGVEIKGRLVILSA